MEVSGKDGGSGIVLKKTSSIFGGFSIYEKPCK